MQPGKGKTKSDADLVQKLSRIRFAITHPLATFPRQKKEHGMTNLIEQFRIIAGIRDRLYHLEKVISADDQRTIDEIRSKLSELEYSLAESSF